VAAAIATLVTIATPHRPVARVDYAMDKYYGAIDNAWAVIWSMGLCLAFVFLYKRKGFFASDCSMRAYDRPALPSTLSLVHGSAVEA
jgi:hypothetical protein